MFGRATITLGIEPHSSCFFWYACLILAVRLHALSRFFDKICLHKKHRFSYSKHAKPPNLFAFDLQRIQAFIDGVESVVELVLCKLLSTQLCHLNNAVHNAGLHGQFQADLVFTSHSTRNRSFPRRSSQPISWPSTKETKPLTQQKYFTNKNKIVLICRQKKNMQQLVSSP